MNLWKVEKTPAEVVTGPVEEPLSPLEVRQHLYLPTNETAGDDELERMIQAAREQWEKDTDMVLIEQTLRMHASGFGSGDFELYKRPIRSVTSVTYYDSNGDSQTLSTDVYTLNKLQRRLELRINQVWPVVELKRYDAVTINYVAGFAEDRSGVPALINRAMLLLLGYWYSANRGDNDRANDLNAYYKIVQKYMRPTYP